MTALLQTQLEALGSLRNAQVELQRIKTAQQFAAVLEPLRRHLKKREHRWTKIARKALKSRRTLRRLRRWDLRPTADYARAASRIHRLIDDRLRRTVDPLASLSPRRATNVAVRHRLRVASRNFRFMLETLPVGCRSGATGRLLSRLRSQVKAVGEVHDREQLLRRVDRLIADGELQPAATRSFRTLLRSEKTKLLQSCASLDQQVCREAQRARHHLRQALLPS